MKSRVVATSLFSVLFSVSALAGTKGKIVENLTDLPLNTLKLVVTSNVQGGPSAGPFAVKSDGSFEVSTSSFYRQSVSLLLPDGRRLYVASNGDKTFKKDLQTVALVQLNPVTAHITLKDGSDAQSWITNQAPNGKLDYTLGDGSTETSSTIQSFFPGSTQTSDLGLAAQYLVFTSAQQMNAPVDIALTVSLDAFGPGAAAPPLAKVHYQGPLTRDLLSQFARIQIDPSQINTSITGSWKGTVSFDDQGRYNNMNFAAQLTCADGVLSGSGTAFSYIFDGTQSAPAPFTISGGSCKDGLATATAQLPLSSTDSKTLISSTQLETVDLKFQSIVGTGSEVIFSTGGKQIASGELGRGK